MIEESAIGDSTDLPTRTARDPDGLPAAATVVCACVTMLVPIFLPRWTRWALRPAACGRPIADFYHAVKNFRHAHESFMRCHFLLLHFGGGQSRPARAEERRTAARDKGTYRKAIKVHHRTVKFVFLTSLFAAASASDGVESMLRGP